MTNRKKNLIEALYGSFMFMDNLPELIDRENIYDETGHVDLEFMTAILQWKDGRNKCESTEVVEPSVGV